MAGHDGEKKAAHMEAGVVILTEMSTMEIPEGKNVGFKSHRPGFES
jgi:hypothetical protein